MVRSMVLKTGIGSTAAAIVCFIGIAQAHVGSPDTFFEGSAGPYKLVVRVSAPQVVPGIADIEIRMADPGIAAVTSALTELTGRGAENGPTPDVATRSAADSQLFTSKAWFMQPGEMCLRLFIDGERGSARLSIPITVFGQATCRMSREMILFLCLCILTLGLSLVAIVSAAAREETLGPGESITATRFRSGRLAGALAALFAMAIALQGGLWWRSEAAKYEDYVKAFKPRRLTLALRDGNLKIQLPSLARPLGPDTDEIPPLNITELVPDHGHLMHLFLIKSQDMSQILHLHPTRIGSDFSQALPSVAEGNYRVFADIVDATGFPWTMIGEVAVSHSSTGSDIIEGGGDKDDSYADLPPITYSETSRNVAWMDGTHLIFDLAEGPLRSRVTTLLRFEVENEAGALVHDLEPYMGMVAHAVIVKSDFSVFAHIHPGGSIPMASMQLAAPKVVGVADSMPGMVMGPAPLNPVIEIPYGFPTTGVYRVVVQFKRAGRIFTGAFDLRVGA